MKKVTVILLILALVLPTAARAEGGAPGVSAAAWAVYDATAERFLATGNADEQRRMASTTKIMTAIVALENFRLDAEVEFSREMIAEGSSMYLQLGEKVALSDLLHGLMMMSGNDAARAVASLADGGEEGFVELMNKKAATMGLKSTSFANPNGLDAEGHYTTARELALIAAEGMKNETFREIVSTASGVFAGRSMTNHNKLLRSLDGCVGVKTGYTTGAGRCLVSAVERDGRLIIITTLYDPNDWADHKALAEWAFERYTPVELVCDGSVVEYLPVEGGVSPKVAVRASDSLVLSLSTDEAARVEKTIYLPKFVYAPIERDTRAGEIVFRLDGEVIGRVGLCYDAEVGRAAARKLNFGEKVKDFFETLAWRLGL